MIIRDARLEDVQGMARVVVDTWLTTYRGLMPDEHLDKLSYADRERSFTELIKDLNDDKFKFVAENNAGNIIGIAIGGLERSGHTIYKGEIYAIYVLEAYQRKAVGKNLVRAAIEWLQGRNINSMLVWVLAGSKYRVFYEDLGGKEVDKKTFKYDEFSADLVAYGWEDIQKNSDYFRRYL